MSDRFTLCTISMLTKDWTITPGKVWWPYGAGREDKSSLFIKDNNGIHKYKRGKESYYHPVNLAKYGLLYLKEENIIEAKKRADKLLDTSVTMHGALYFPYLFEAAAHRYKLVPPWYSGMAQGMALSLLTRVYAKTLERKYYDAAFKTYKSFKILGGPECVFVDKDGYYWIDEYPKTDEKGTVLNGFLFGVQGLYDYWCVSKSESVKRLLKAALTTVEKVLPLYRSNDSISYYCTAHKVKSKNYHEIHLKQLEFISSFTGDNYFTSIL